MKRILLVLPLVLLCWAPAAHAQQTLPGLCPIRGIAYGTTPATGSISVAGGQGCHRFTGARGDVVRVRLIRTSGTLDPTVGVAPPGGGTGCTATTDDEFKCAIRIAGQYTMVVRDAAGTATGTYALSVQRLDDPVGCATLSYATRSTAGALLPGEAGCWRFTGTRPDRVRIRVVARSSALAPQFVVVDQRGRSTCPPDAGNPSCWLRRTGTHTIFVADAAGPGAGDYAIAIQRLNDPVGCTTLAFGAAPSAGTVASDGETDCYRVAAAAGDRVHVRLESMSAGLSPAGELLHSDGTRACPPTTADESTCLLSASGTYTILAGDAAGTNNGDYSIAVQRLNRPVGCTPLAFATLPTPAAIGAAREVDCFRFDGAAGDRVRVSAITLAGDAAVAEVVGPDGATGCRTFGPRFTCALDRTGVHTLFVVSDSRIQTSTYSVLIQRLNDPVGCRSIAFGSPTIQTSVTWAAETDCYRLDGGAGAVARLVFTGSLRQHVVVVGPDGAQRCEARHPLPVLGFNCTFAGRHTILVEDDSGKLSGGYTIATQRANYCGGGDSLYPGIGGAQRRSISTGDVDCWDFGGLDAGRRLEVRLTRRSGALDPVAELLRPDGTRLCGPTTADEFVCVTDTTGGNHLLVGGTAAGATGTYEIEVS